MPDEHKTHCCSCRADEHLDLGDYTALDCDENYVVSSGPTKKGLHCRYKKIGRAGISPSKQPTDRSNVVRELFDDFDARLCSSLDPRHTIADVQKICCIF